ncbi:nucleolar protein 56 [Nephila pilipes]|uniref:Nucleolar protein 56 n=1 Tax=Nephila pilipes TaxID=299642 RepID=A0A8X6QU71_NEPPI|nr:nucleolar protein 56 [Nephila pilipes]
MSNLYILFEHAAGYSLFKCDGSEDILSQVKQKISKVKRFKEICHFVAFQPFKTGRVALENMNCISEGILHSHLEEFLVNAFPKKKKQNILGIVEPKLAAAISEKLGINCTAVPEILELHRGIRKYFSELIEGFNDADAADKAQLGLGHSYSRARVKFNVGRNDNMIIQSISLLDQLDKDINTFFMRVREWYSHHFPELFKIVSDNTLYIQCIQIIRDRKNLAEDVAERLESLLNDPVKTQNILEMARSSMGMDISELDLQNVYVFAERILSLTRRRKETVEYLREKMQNVSPNLAALIGDAIAARLIAHAGSLIGLAKYPASTVQILGAEKALFRALKTRGNTPKYGLIFNSRFIAKAAQPNKGRISRYLANKISVATRIDCFRDVPTDVFGNMLKQQVEDRLKFFETGELPKTNEKAMDEALDEAAIAEVQMLKQLKKQKKNAKKRKLEESGIESSFLSSGADDSVAASTEGEDRDTSVVKKKRRDKKQKVMEVSLNEDVEDDGEVKKQSGDDFINSSENHIQANGDLDLSAKKKKKKAKKKKLLDANTEMEVSLNEDVENDGEVKKKEQSGDDSINSSENHIQANGDLDLSAKKKKKNKAKKNKHLDAMTV